MAERLDGIKLGSWCNVVEIDADEALRHRLRDFGLRPGTKVCPEYRSPGGHGTVISFRGTHLALRTRDLHKIWVR